MKVGLECYPCFLKQAIEASAVVTKDENLRYEIVKEVLREILVVAEERSDEITPVHIGMAIHKLIRELGNNGDPYIEIKRQYNEKALSLYRYMKGLVKKSTSPLETAVKLAIAGNIIDFGVGELSEKIEIEHIIEDAIGRNLAINDFETFRDLLKEAGSILYLADNTGEIVFDRILIEEIPNHRNRVKLVVKKAPIINDATYEDAEAVGLAGIVPVMDNGLAVPGAILDQVSKAFLEELDRADIVISKGQGNYEGLSDTHYPIFFLLKAKCAVIARELKVKIGDTVLRYNLASEKEKKGADRIRTGA